MAFTYCRGCSGKVEIGAATCSHCGIPRPAVFRRPGAPTPTVRHKISGAGAVVLWTCGVLVAMGLIVPAMSSSARRTGVIGSAFMPGRSYLPGVADAGQAVPEGPDAVSGRKRFEQVAAAIRRGFPHVRVARYDAAAPRTMHIIVPGDYPSYRARTLAEEARERLGPDAQVDVTDPTGRSIASAEARPE